MDIKKVETMAKDKDLTNAWFCGYLLDFYKEEFEEDYEDYYDFSEVKEWHELTDAQKEKLIERAIYYWTKDENGADICAICNCVMLNQKAILDGKMEKWDFLDDLLKFI